MDIVELDRRQTSPTAWAHCKLLVEEMRIILLLALLVLSVYGSSNEVFQRKYSSEGCQGDIESTELRYTLNQCDKSTKYILEGSNVLKCQYKDTLCEVQSEGKCGNVVTLNVCVDDHQSKKSSEYILGNDASSPFLVAMLAVVGTAGYIYNRKKQQQPATPIPATTSTPITTSTPEPTPTEHEDEEEETPKSPPSANAIKDVDNQLSSILARLKITGPITKIGDCKYQIGSKKVTMQVQSGYLVVRVGGGFMKFEEWIQRFGRKEGVVIAGELISGVGVGTLNSHGGHTIKAMPKK